MNDHPVRFPNVTVRLTEEDGNAFAILSRVRIALKRAGAKMSDLEEFTIDATSSDYAHLLATVQKWVEVE